MGTALLRARQEWEWTQEELTIEVQKARRTLGLAPLKDDESARRQIIAFETGQRRVGPTWRPVLALALQLPEEMLFGLGLDAQLPPPLLVSASVTPAMVHSISQCRIVHIGVDHVHGPEVAQSHVERDLITVQQMVDTAPRELRAQVKNEAALLAELGGWIAQDSGDFPAAQRHTEHAWSIATTSPDTVRAMLLMRLSNIISRVDPKQAVDYADEAAYLISNHSGTQLHAAARKYRAPAGSRSSKRQRP